MLKRLAISVLAINLFLASVSPCYGFQRSPWTKETSYNKKMYQKFMFGLTNANLGFLEVFTEPYEAVKEDRMIWVGLAIGVFNGVVDTVGGVLHLVTFFITPLDIPLPEGGTDIGK